MASKPVIIVGAGIGGLACAVDLAARGVEVLVLERAATPGGKLREVTAGGLPVDSGPTVFTMRWVFDALFDDAGSSTSAELGLTPARVIARHAWTDSGYLDLYATMADSAAAIGAFCGAAEGKHFVAFCDEARRIYLTLRDAFLTAPRPSQFELVRRIGLHRLGALFAIRPFETMWGALSKHFTDPRLRQLFGRYATYCGSSPFLAPATLMLIAHVEQEGVWLVEGGMQRLADALHRVAERRGASFRFNAAVRALATEGGRVSGVELETGEIIAAQAIVWNGDTNALAAGLAGPGVRRAVSATALRERSLSAITWTMAACTDGFPLARHTVFFGGDYAGEFKEILSGRRVPSDPTVYVCAQDRADDGGPAGAERERLLVLINAPPVGDAQPFGAEEIASCADRTFRRLRQCGLTIQPGAAQIATSPADFHRLFPATGGALYGRASHGSTASFRRPGSRTTIPGLYLAGGSVHPGAGVPMAALSGRLAASALIADRPSTRR